jgi:hypothetical protein
MHVELPKGVPSVPTSALESRSGRSRRRIGTSAFGAIRAAGGGTPDKLRSILRRPSLRSQLNQIRLWVRQGRTDAWIAHKLDISVGQLEQFKRDHLEQSDPTPVDAAPAPSADLEAPAEDDHDVAPPEAEEAEEAEGAADEPTRRRRRGRRGGRRRSSSRSATSYEGTFEHGGEGYGLWLDPAVADSQVYVNHWAGHRAVAVTVEPDAITIRRIDERGGDGDQSGDGDEPGDDLDL